MTKPGPLRCPHRRPGPSGSRGAAGDPPLAVRPARPRSRPRDFAWHQAGRPDRLALTQADARPLMVPELIGLLQPEGRRFESCRGSCHFSTNKRFADWCPLPEITRFPKRCDGEKSDRNRPHRLARLKYGCSCPTPALHNGRRSMASVRRRERGVQGTLRACRIASGPVAGGVRRDASGWASPACRTRTWDAGRRATPLKILARAPYCLASCHRDDHASYLRVTWCSRCSSVCSVGKTLRAAARDGRLPVDLLPWCTTPLRAENLP